MVPHKLHSICYFLLMSLSLYLWWALHSLVSLNFKFHFMAISLRNSPTAFRSLQFVCNPFFHITSVFEVWNLFCNAFQAIAAFSIYFLQCSISNKLNPGCKAGGQSWSIKSIVPFNFHFGFVFASIDIIHSFVSKITLFFAVKIKLNFLLFLKLAFSSVSVSINGN